jgi:hypothetical protein
MLQRDGQKSKEIYGTYLQNRITISGLKQQRHYPSIPPHLIWLLLQALGNGTFKGVTIVSTILHPDTQEETYKLSSKGHDIQMKNHHDETS